MSENKKVKEIQSGWLGFLVMVAGASCRPEVLKEAVEHLDASDTHYELDREGFVLLLDSIRQLCEVKQELADELAPECPECGADMIRPQPFCEDCERGR